MTGTSEGGRKAAATRGHDSLSEAGRKGGFARAEKDPEGLRAAGRKGGQISAEKRRQKRLVDQ